MKPTPKNGKKRPTTKPVGILEQLAELTALVAGQRRDYDHLAEVMRLRDQLADERNITNMQNAKRLDDVDRGLSSTQHVVVALQDRLSFYERSVPSIAAAYKQYQGAMKSEKKRREKVIAEHPEWTDREKLMFRRTGEMPGAKKGAAVTVEDVHDDGARPHELSLEEARARARHGSGQRPASFTEREEAAERASLAGDGPE